MLEFLAQAANNMPNSETIGLWGTGGLGAVLLYLFGPVLREKLPGAKSYRSPMRDGDSEKLHEVHKVVTIQDGEHYLALFPRREMATIHAEQTKRIEDVSQAQQRIADSQVRLAELMVEIATIIKTRKD